MTEIKINRLILENFKCHRHLCLDFMGGNASIYGDNATGKTSIYDGLTWLLFGKDSHGNGEKNIDIKPLGPDGEVFDHEAQTSVEAVLLVDGEELTLRRTYREVWAARRGSSETVFEGNTSEYYVDGVPCKKNAFQEKVNGLVSEDTFRMLTSVSHFAGGISWQERRAVLFKLAGVAEDRQIMETDPRFGALLESMGKLTLEEYKKKLLAEKRGFVGAKTDIPARISECQKTVEEISGLDFGGAKAEAEEIHVYIDARKQQLLEIEHSQAAEKLKMDIRETRMQLKDLETENIRHRDSQRTGEREAEALEGHIERLKLDIARERRRAEGEYSLAETQEQRIHASRKKWIDVNSKALSVNGTCPTCHQPLPNDKLLEAQASAEAQKKLRLDEILAQANILKESHREAIERAAAAGKRADEMEFELEAREEELLKARGSIREIQDMPGYESRRAGLMKALDALEGSLADISAESLSIRQKIQGEISGYRARLSELNFVISKESLLAYSRERIEALREEARNAGECLEAIEGMLFLLDEFSRYKTRFVEESINGLFRIARFRLFREQANGGVEDRCDVVCDGIPYMSVNNGMKINLGIDIINTVSTAYGVKVPLFVDNAECVTDLEKCGSQIIRLVVSEKDKELRADYEN